MIGGKLLHHSEEVHMGLQPIEAMAVILIVLGFMNVAEFPKTAPKAV